MTIYLVAYVDEDGPYAAAFYTRAAAQQFADDIGDATVIETEVN